MTSNRLHFRISTAAVLSALGFGCSQMVTAPVSPSGPLASTQPPPTWAYPVQPPFTAPVDDGVPRRVPGSEVAFTLTQIRDLFVAPNWHPGDQPPPTGVVGLGRKPDMFACGYCHYPNGQGRPENSSLAGLSAAYITQQMADYKSGRRKSSEAKMRPVALMVSSGQAATDDDVRNAANYFAGLKYKPWVKVVEAASVPQTRVAGSMLAAIPGSAMEPIGQRIIELADDVNRTTLRDPRSGFTAYVPVGSIARGQSLATTGGNGRTTVCATCHGQDLRGLGDVPPLAGRSPSYAVRQLYDFQSGARAGSHSALMKESVANLSIEDMVAIAAYTASLQP
jgi:cytochrome c553